MKRILAFILIFLITFIAFATPKALIIHVSQFKNSEISPLSYAKNDAMRFKETLTNLDLVSEENITFLENPTLADMKVAIREFFASAKTDDVLYFFYTGHGYYDEKSSKTYLIPWDTNPRYLQDTAY